MAVHQVNPQGSKLAALDPIWDRVRGEAEDIVRREPELASFIYSTVLHHERLEDSVIHRLAERLDHSALSGDLIRQTYDEALRDEPDLGNAFRADLVAVYDRDPATSRFIDPLLYFKGFHALQTHRLAHWLYKKGRKDFAYYLQSRSSAVFQTDINPAARIGRGIFLDHATGFVCGETAVIEDDVSILHGVTLGGTGKENEDRHPEDSPRRADRGGREDSRQYRDRPLRAHRRGLGGGQAGAAQRHGGRRSRQDRRRGRLRRAVAHHGPDAQRDRALIFHAFLTADLCEVTAGGLRRLVLKTSRKTKIRLETAVDVQEVRKLDAYLKRVFGNPKIRVVPRPKKDDSAEVYIGEEFIGVLFVDDEDDDRSFQFQMAILEEDLVDQG